MLSVFYLISNESKHFKFPSEILFYLKAIFSINLNIGTVLNSS